jgi:hypothetical protein
MNVVSIDEISYESMIAVAERRSTSRFPLASEVSYKYKTGKLTAAGVGQCVNIGSGGVLFTTRGRLPIGRTIELSLNWPALLDGACPLKFIASGPVVRADEGSAAMRIDRYEFRTRATRPGLAASIQELRVR